MTNYNLYKTFKVVAETKNITKASEILRISQPAISFQIQQLEQELNGELFIRKNKGVELTLLGSMIYEKVSKIINELDFLQNLGPLQKSLEEGVLRIGANSSNCNQIISNYLIDFASKHPNLKIIMIRGNSEVLLNKLENNMVDIIFIDTIEHKLPITCIKKFPVEYQLIGNKDFYLKFKNHNFNDSDFLKSNLILPNATNNSRKYIDNYCQQNGLLISPKYELDNYILVYDFVKNGLGVAFVNLEYYKDKIDSKEVYPISPKTKIKMREFSVYINPSLSNPAKDEFIKILNKE